MEDHNPNPNPSEDLKLQAGLREGDSSDSSCMVVLKVPPVEEDDEAPASSRTPASRVRRKKTVKKEAYDNDMTSKRSKLKRERFDSEEHISALNNAKELQANLSSEQPSFIKQLQRSHVIKKFVLGVPKDFCSLHLPAHSSDVTLEDESRESYIVKFHAGIEGVFMGGWKKFSLAHNLLEGDVLVCHLLKPCYFKVYIVRANNPNAVPSSDLASLDVHTNEGNKKRKCEVAAPADVIQESSRKSPLLLSSSDLAHGSSHSVRNDRHSSERSCRLSGSDADFEKFKITVNGESVDSELSLSTRLKYYELCCSRGSHLHKHLLENVDRAFATSLITGTLKAADAIRNLTISSPEKEFAMWGNTLEGFEAFGMEVRFLIERLKRLARLGGSELGQDEELKRYVETEKKRDCMLEEMRNLEAKMAGLKQATEKLEEEMKALKVDVVKQKDYFQQEANAPW